MNKAIGVCYTPEAIAFEMVANCVGKLLAGKTPQQASRLKILDLACGDGVFLRCAYQYLVEWYSAFSPLTVQQRQQILLNQIYGVDIDAKAVEAAKQALDPDRTLPQLSQNIKCGNAIIDFNWFAEFPEIMQAGGFDAAIGNPPYADSEWMSLHLPEWRTYCTQHYQAASGNWDLFCVFIELALKLCKPNGLNSFIVPNKLASASYASKAREILTLQNCLLSIRDYSSVPVFPVAVYPLIYLTQKRSPLLTGTVYYERMRQGSDRQIQSAKIEQLSYRQYFANPKQPWQIFSEHPTVSVIHRLQSQFSPLETLATVMGAATVAEAYQIQALLCENVGNETNGLKVINSGTIDRYRLLWGQKPLRYLGKRYLHPVIPQHSFAQLPQKRLQQAQQAKIIVAGMTKVLECAIDLKGSMLAGKSTVIIFSSLDLRYLLALLNSRAIAFYYRSVFGGDRLQGGYLPIGVSQLRSLPIPRADTVTQNQLIERVNPILDLYQQTPTPEIQDQITILEAQIDRLVCELYQLDLNLIQDF